MYRQVPPPFPSDEMNIGNVVLPVLTPSMLAITDDALFRAPITPRPFTQYAVQSKESGNTIQLNPQRETVCLLAPVTPGSVGRAAQPRLRRSPRLHHQIRLVYRQ